MAKKKEEFKLIKDINLSDIIMSVTMLASVLIVFFKLQTRVDILETRFLSIESQIQETKAMLLRIDDRLERLRK